MSTEASTPAGSFRRTALLADVLLALTISIVGLWLSPYTVTFFHVLTVASAIIGLAQAVE